MNGYTLIHKMLIVRRQYKLSVSAQALYHELVAICNNKRWPETFTCSNATLCKSLAISEPTLQKARLSLINAGLICFRSGKSDHTKSSYAFAIVDKEVTKETTKESLVETTREKTTTQKEQVVTTKKETDYIKQYNKNLSPLSPKGKKSKCERILFYEIINRLPADKVWLEFVAKRLGIEESILPGLINTFSGFIIATGDEYTIPNLREAKRRFYCWWRKYGQWDSATRNPKVGTFPRRSLDFYTENRGLLHRKVHTSGQGRDIVIW